MRITRFFLLLIILLSFKLSAKEIKFAETSTHFEIIDKSFSEFTIINYLSTIGSSKNITSEIDINEILKSYNIKNLARSSPKFDNKDLVKINSDIIKKLSFKDVEKNLKI